MTFYISIIVEGQTEVDSIERLLQRIWNEILHVPYRLQVLPASRAPHASLIQTDGEMLPAKVQEARLKLERYLSHGLPASGCVLLLLDADRNCPAELGPQLALAMTSDHPPEIRSFCVLAKRMFENWIIAGAGTLAKVNGLPEAIPERDKPEDLSGAAWLESQLRSVKSNRKYKKTEDAKVFVKAMDIVECQAKSRSFERLVRKLSQLVGANENAGDELT
jgi:hypothetical protein